MSEVNEIISRPGIERATLSILLRNKDRAVEAFANGLFAEHFSIKSHQIIYSVCVHLAQSTNIQHFDSLIIYNTVTDPKSKEALDEVGGMEYIDLLLVAPIADNLDFYIKKLKEAHLLRQVYGLAESVQGKILEHTEDASAEEILQSFQEQILNISIQQGEGASVKKIGEGASERLRVRIENPTDVLGFRTGWKEFDKHTQGLCSNDLTVIVGEAKTGKSAALLNISKKLSVDDLLPGLYIDTEMTTEEQEDRLISLISGVPFEEIRNGMYIKDTEYGNGFDKTQAVQSAIAKLENAPLYHVFLPDFSIDKVSALVRRYKTQYNIQYFVFDYIKLPDSEVRNLQNAQEWQRLGYFTSCLKNLCGICNIPGLTAAQANRTSIGNTNQDANSIGGSYRILQLATRLCFIRNKLPHEMEMEGYRNGNQVLKIAYQRHGSSRGIEINMQFDNPILRMREIGLRE